MIRNTRNLSEVNPYYYSIAFLAWMVLITVLSLSSFEDLDTSSFDVPYTDKAVHFFFYFVASVLCFLYYLHPRSFNRKSSVKGIITLIIVLVLYGILIEVLQYKFIPNRSGEVLDVAANTTGVILGIGFVKIFFYRNSQLK